MKENTTQSKMKKTQILKMQTTESESTEKFAENTGNEQSSTSLIERTRLENTPFTAVSHEGNNILTLGRYKIAEGFNDTSEMHDYIQNNLWHCIGVLVQAILDNNNNEQQ